MRIVLWMGCAFYFLVGVVHVFIGSLSPHLFARYGIGAREISVILSVQFIGFLIGVLFSPVFSKKLGPFGVITIGLCMVGAALAGYLWIDRWELLSLTGFLIGYGAGTLETTVGALIIGQGVSGKSGMAKLEVFFGFGALLFPILIHLLAGEDVLLVVLSSLLATIVVLLTVWVFLTSVARLNQRFPQPEGAGSDTEEFFPGNTPMREKRCLGLLIVFAFVYAGIETSYANFLPSLLIAGGYEPYSLIGVSVFWASMVVGRTLLAVKGRNIPPLPILQISALSLILFLGVFPFLHDAILVLAAIFLTGIAAAPLFPVAITFAASVSRGHVDEVTSYFIAAASLGGSLISLLVGWSLTLEELPVTLFLFAGLALLLWFISFRLKDTGSSFYKPAGKSMDR
ncbi:MFS transporter [Paenibacillus sp. UNC499MF]|uniref:MFS transporter n=1 Tax=Paenibacillus sp. UNC499MF TaxID=1502751 RepID=UPI00089FA7AB|nr:MFS transporter [Paenibacillus sp. UNC499MF]SEF42847.1 MFS transporter, FHS family, glucose/mannose:H+ symporter [Paenibacillus sp. UNC499MF]